MNIFKACKYTKAYPPHICTVDGEYGCYESECGDTDSGNDMWVFVIKIDAILTHTEWEIQFSWNHN
jgi:hypothetical protein